MARTVEILLPSVAEARKLFSYPNTGHEDQSLEETIRHYLAGSLAREGYGASQAEVRVSDGECRLRLTLPTAKAAAAVEKVYEQFFDLGRIGLRQAADFRNTGKWHPAWRFLLPLGIPMANALSVEIMDFPPLSLITKQDYLNSKTTGRWWELLEMNGVVGNDRARHSCICDIVPVAAPAGDGEILDQSGIYEGPFDEYSLALLDLYARGAGGDPLRPLMALGRPIRLWMKRIWDLDLRVGDVGEIELPEGGTSPVCATNHPSFFFYAVRSATGPGSDAKNLATGLAVLKQDIVAAAWQTDMGGNAGADPVQTLRDCEQQWRDRDEELLEVVRRQGGLKGKLLAKASLIEVKAEAPTPDQLEDLERAFYAAGGPGAVESTDDGPKDADPQGSGG